MNSMNDTGVIAGPASGQTSHTHRLRGLAGTGSIATLAAMVATTLAAALAQAVGVDFEVPDGGETIPLSTRNPTWADVLRRGPACVIVGGMTQDSEMRQARVRRRRIGHRKRTSCHRHERAHAGKIRVLNLRITSRFAFAGDVVGQSLLSLKSGG